MECLKKYKDYLDKFRRIYILSFVIFLLLTRIVLVVNIITIPVNTLLYQVFACIGAILVLFDFLSNFYQFKSKENILLTAFFIVCIISSIVNMDYGISDNLKTLVWTAIQFFVLFSMLHIQSKDEIYKNMSIVMKTSAWVWFAAVVISIIQFVLQISYRAPLADYPRRQGFMESRLFGIFPEPNWAAVTSLFIIVFCYFLRKKCEKKWLRRLYIVNIICQIIYIVLSGSRTGMLEAVVLGFVLVFIEARNKAIGKSKKNPIFIATIKGGISVGLVILTFILLPTPLLEITKISADIKVNILDESEEDIKEVTLDRDDVNENNITNNRLQIWSSMFMISGDNRIVGLSPRNVLAYAKVNYPDSFVVKKNYECHNGYLAVLASTGIVGTVIILLFILYILFYLYTYIKNKKGKEYDDVITIIFCTDLMIAISAGLQLDIFFVNTYSAAVFWLFTGYMLYLLKHQMKVED